MQTFQIFITPFFWTINWVSNIWIIINYQKNNSLELDYHTDRRCNKTFQYTDYILILHGHHLQKGNDSNIQLRLKQLQIILISNDISTQYIYICLCVYVCM